MITAGIIQYCGWNLSSMLSLAAYIAKPAGILVMDNWSSSSPIALRRGASTGKQDRGVHVINREHDFPPARPGLDLWKPFDVPF